MQAPAALVAPVPESCIASPSCMKSNLLCCIAGPIIDALPATGSAAARRSALLNIIKPHSAKVARATAVPQATKCTWQAAVPVLRYACYSLCVTACAGKEEETHTPELCRRLWGGTAGHKGEREPSILTSQRPSDRWQVPLEERRGQSAWRLAGCLVSQTGECKRGGGRLTSISSSRMLLSAVLCVACSCF